MAQEEIPIDPSARRSAPSGARPLRRRRSARREDLGLTRGEFGLLRRLDSPQKIQAYLNALPINHEPDGETLYSVRGVLRHRCALCIEGAFVAACALWIHGEAPLVLHLDCAASDYSHVVALFRRGARWGAISKTNGPVLRYRDPIYRTLRELALSYFHEYFDRRGYKTLRSYTGAFDLRRLDPELWVTREDACQEANDILVDRRHYPLLSPAQIRRLARRDPFEREAARLVQYPKPAPRRA